MTETNNPPDSDSDKPTEQLPAEKKHTDEKEYDDTDYTTKSFRVFLEKPPLLPHEDENAFAQLVDDIELMFSYELKTPMEYFLLSQICTQMQNVLRYDSMKIELMQSHTRAALEDLFMKTEDPTGMDPAASKVMAFKNANMWFANAEYRVSTAKSFEAAGYRPNVIESEAFRRSLPSLATLDRLIASAQKSVLTLMKELEKRCRDREAEECDD